MAFGSVGSLGTAASGIGASSIAVTLGANAEAGNLVVFVYAGDNLGSGADDADNSEVTSISDSATGNTWLKLKENSNNNGGAALGATVSVWYSVLTNQINSGGTITANLSGSPAARAATVWEFTKTGGTTISVEQTAANSGDAADPQAISLAGMASREYLFIWGLAYEGTTGGGFTDDADYTQITVAGQGAGAAAMVAWGAFRIATLTGDTVDAATTTDRDYSQVLGALYEVAAASDDLGADYQVNALGVTVY